VRAYHGGVGCLRLRKRVPSLITRGATFALSAELPDGGADGGP
jgi:hypothetical protein